MARTTPTDTNADKGRVDAPPRSEARVCYKARRREALGGTLRPGGRVTGRQREAAALE